MEPRIDGKHPSYRNEKYKGDALLQKTFTVDFLTKKMKPNEGEVPQYYVVWIVIQLSSVRRSLIRCKLK